ncbi:nucleoporin Nup43-like [Diadema antillarum]|uniref:nucleoporin Nup43-like n=1 Tax=Diadema antillarum TaxID=105358 RepID=UPI003A851001
MDVIVKFVSHKIGKIRWQPSPCKGIQFSDTFVTGSWDDEVNKLSLWKVPESQNRGPAWQQEYVQQTAGRNTGTLDGVGEADTEPMCLCQLKHVGDVTDIQFASQDVFVASSSTGTVQAYRCSKSKQELVEFQRWEGIHHHRTEGCSCTCVSVNGTDVATCGEDGRIIVLRLDHRQPIRTLDEADSCSINALAHLKQHEVITVNSAGQLKIWDLRQPGSQPTRFFIISGEKVPLHCVDRHPTQPHLVATGGQNGILNIWDMRKEQLPVTLFDVHQSHVWEVKFHPTNPNNLFTCSDDGTVLHWDATKGQSGAAFRSVNTPTGPGASSNLLRRVPTKSAPSVDGETSSPWLNSDSASGQLEINHVLPSNVNPVNSLDVEGPQLVCGTDGEALYYIPNMNIYL